MPRRLAHSDESPVPRRTSARIAAVQAASPAKSPAKATPRRKRQSADVAKSNSEDTESQQSQVKSEVSLEEMNGLETSSSTKDTSESIDLPAKKPKIDSNDEDLQEDEEIQQPLTIDTPPVTPTPANVSLSSDSGVEKSESQLMETELVRLTEPTEPELNPDESASEHTPVSPIEFEVVEKSDLPAADSAEVQAALAVQGEDGQLLAGFVQVDEDDLPAATSMEIKQVTSTQECETHPLETIPEVTETVAPPVVTPINGDAHEESCSVEPTQNEPVQSKPLPSDDLVPHVEQAAGDNVLTTNIEVSSQL